MSDLDEPPEARRMRRRRRNRTRMFTSRMRAADRPMAQLATACDYLRAAASGLPPDRVTALAHQVAQLAEEASQ